jgi:1-aminocyclopropane-1-carboxylate deaminase
MEIVPVPKAEYDALKRTGGPYPAEFSGYFAIPEGGNTPEALHACRGVADEVWDELGFSADEPVHFCAPAGTGCTAAGVASGLSERPNARLWAFPASKGGPDEAELFRLLANAGIDPVPLEGRVRVLDGYLAGGFARFDPDVLEFAEDFERQHGFLLDPVYTAKMAWGVHDLLAKGHFPDGSTVVMLHTGGLQGWEGFRSRFLF